MSTKKTERIKIWFVAVLMLIGTGVSLMAMALSFKNNQTDQSKYQSAYNEYMEAVNAQAKVLSDTYYPIFSQYASRVGSYDAKNATSLETQDLLIGEGGEIAPGSPYSAYYIGWDPEGNIFDQSISEGALKAPLPGGGMIEGWNQGVIGMKFGGVREILIPSELAYGESGNGENIPPNTPLKFVVMVIPKVKDIEIPEILLEYYS